MNEFRERSPMLLPAGVTLSNNNPTLADWKAALGPDQKIGMLINQLEATNEILSDMTMLEGNEPTGHLMNVATGLPPVVWRRLYEGVSPGKGKRVQVRESVGWMEAFNEIDAKLVKLNGNGTEFRLQEAQLQIEAMTQSMANKVFYGNPDTDDRDIMGLAPRFSSKSAQNGRNIIDAGGEQGDNRSIWLVNWGPNACFSFVPKGSEAGLQMEDLGMETAENFNGETGKLLRVYRAHFMWDAGLGLADWRYVVRIANIDFSELKDDASNGANLPVLMSKAIRKVPRMKLTRPAFYMSGDVVGFLESQLSAAIKESTLTREEVGGVMTTSFKGIPLRQVDELEADEARVT